MSKCKSVFLVMINEVENLIFEIGMNVVSDPCMEPGLEIQYMEMVIELMEERQEEESSFE